MYAYINIRGSILGAGKPPTITAAVGQALRYNPQAATSQWQDRAASVESCRDMVRYK